MLRLLPALLLGACAVPGDPPAARAPADREAAAKSAPRPHPNAMDRSPGRRTLAPNGRWEAVVAEGGALAFRPAGRFGEEVAVDVDVDPRVAFSGDTVYYAKRGEWAETDLWRVTLPDGEPTPVTHWPGSEDRPVVSPDGRHLAFVSGRTGLASWWVVDLGVLPAKEGTQVTNVGVTRGRPGQAPAGWVPPPDGTTYAWTDAGLAWVSEGVAYTAVPK
ncbi:MAG: TolB family protein [Myxococcota bacterium]